MGQNMVLEGKVIDTVSKRPLPNALATLVRVRDSVLIDFKRSDKEGQIKIVTPIDTCYLVINHPRFGERFYYIFGSEDNASFNLGNIILPEKDKELDEIIVYAYRDPVYYKGDTLVYLADSFPTRPNAVVEDLLKKLPGITVEADGSLKSGGKQIDQVLVDGDEFFGSDPTIATKNLAATSIQSVQIYEKKDENSNDDDMLQVLDLRLKDEAKNGYFGKVDAASDFSKYYETEAMVNYFKGKRKISAFALYSNTNRSNVNSMDMATYGMAEGGNFSRYNEESDNWESSSNSVGVGVPNVFRGGVYFNDQLSKNTKLNANYTMTDTRLRSEGSRYSQYLLPDTTYFTDLRQNNVSSNQSHEIKIRLDQKLDSLTTLIVEPNFKKSMSESETTNITAFLDDQSSRIRNNSVKNGSNSDQTSFNARAELRRNFMKKNRNLNVQYRINLDDNKSNGNLYSLNIYDNVLQANDTIDQFKNNLSKSISNNANFSYIEPLNKKWKVGVDYEWNQNNNTQLKESFNASNGIYNQLDSTLTNNFENRKTTNRIGAQLFYNVGKHSLNAGVRLRNTQMRSDNLFNNISIDQNVNNILPRLRYTYKISLNSQVRINYTSTSSLPSINQLQPVLDNTNPNRRVIGNPDLIPNFNNRISANYNIYKPLTGTYFFASLNYNVLQNAFSNATTFEADGSTTTQTINVNGNANANAAIYYGYPFYDKKFYVKPSLMYSNNRYNTLVNSAKNLTKDNVYTANLELSYTTDSLEINIEATYNHQNTQSTIANTSVIPYANQEYSLEVNWILPLRFRINVDNTYYINSKLAQGYNLKYLITNVELNRNFLKKENLIASVKIYDLFNQNVNAQRTVSSNVITDSKTFVISRYFLIGLTYKFSSSGKTPEPNFMMHD